MPGTRLRVLSMFMEWAKDDPMRIIWLAGLAGTGKTSIAVTLCRMLKDEPDVVLGGVFFCSRTANVVELTDARCILPTLAVDLAEKSPEFAAALLEELNADSRIILKPISIQIGALLQRPLTALSSSPHVIVFIVDALDECSDEKEVKNFLRAISTLESDAKVKFIVTSRPETHINTSPISSSDRNSILRLHTIDTAEVTEDIRLYIDDAFSKQPLDEAWYTETDVNLLASRADGLFIFASTIVAYVLSTEAAETRAGRLRKALFAMKDSKVATRPLDAVYEFVLTRASDTAKVEPEELADTKQVIACILSARTPLSIVALAEILGRKPDVLRESLRRLRSVVHVPDDIDQPGLRTVHTSLGDYLIERAAAELRIPAVLGDESFATGCFRVMRKSLHFNISQSHSSYAENPPTKPDSFTLSLEYACLQWIYHVASLPQPWSRDEDIQEIFLPRFLFWLEAMSVLGEVQRAGAMLIFASTTVCPYSKKLCASSYSSLRFSQQSSRVLCAMPTHL